MRAPSITRVSTLLLACLALLAASLARAEGADDAAALLRALPKGSFGDRIAVVNRLAATGEAAVVPALEALAAGDLYVRKSDGAVFVAKRTGRSYALADPLAGTLAGEAAAGEVEKIKVNNAVRRAVNAALGALTLRAGDAAQRRAAAGTMLRAADPETIEALDAAIAAETDPGVRAVMEQARAAAVLKSGRGMEEKREAIRLLAERGGRDALTLLAPYASSDEPELRSAAAAAIAGIERDLALWGAAQNVWYGLSLGSVLLLAAIGLAVTFGVMGVINMAHGEMVMLGAYTTFVVQDWMRSSAPGLFDYSLALALPLAFLVAGAVGFAMERGLIRWLYGRPLETLLATWGVSLILQQAVRTGFGPTNREVGNPSWMSGAFDLGGLSITWNRLWIIVFSAAVFGLLLLALRHTAFGLQVRAVMQNRRMASSMGIRTPWIDAFTFALGSGIAGMAGVALSQIDNVSPDLGTGYIIDSFMVVVFGGVGSLWGTLVGAMTLGVVNKFLEPYAGAVLAKILVLVFIILFIQRRPRGLFAPRGRAVEA